MKDLERFQNLLAQTASAAEALAGEYGPSLRAQAARELALDLGLRLEALAGYATRPAPPDDLLAAEAAQLCGDLATLAACNADLLAASSKAATNAVEAAARSAELLLGEPAKTGEAAGRDARSALWKISVAKGQLRQETSPGSGGTNPASPNLPGGSEEMPRL